MTEVLKAAAARFAHAKAEIVACGVPADVVDAALRPLWRAVAATLDPKTKPGSGIGQS